MELVQVDAVHHVSGGDLLDEVEVIAELVFAGVLDDGREGGDLVVVHGRAEGVGVVVVVRVGEVVEEARHGEGRISSHGYRVEVARVLIGELVHVAETPAELKDPVMAACGVGGCERCSEAEIDLGTVVVIDALALIEVLSGVEEVDSGWRGEFGSERVRGIEAELDGL